jgi:hypothetical protein
MLVRSEIDEQYHQPMAILQVSKVANAVFWLQVSTLTLLQKEVEF